MRIKSQSVEDGRSDTAGESAGSAIGREDSSTAALSVRSMRVSSVTCVCAYGEKDTASSKNENAAVFNNFEYCNCSPTLYNYQCSSVTLSIEDRISVTRTPKFSSMTTTSPFAIGL